MSVRENRRQVAQIVLDDVNTDYLIEQMSSDSLFPRVAIGIHITTLNAIYSGELQTSDFANSDFVYCDGWSIYVLGRICGLRNIERIATTDLYPLIIERMNRDLRICFVGGESVLGDKIVANWFSNRPRDTCIFFDGYQKDWPQTFEMIRDFKPDLIFLGLGMPNELHFFAAYKNLFPNCSVITCGGMLRILAGTEKRSPEIFQHLRLEWLFRLFTSPKRTFLRYSLGLVNIFRCFLELVIERLQKPN